MSSQATKSYLMQRVTGVVMIPISIWILFCLLPKVGIMIFHQDVSRHKGLYDIFSGLDSITYILIFTICGLYHGILGMQSVINDYIHCKVMKKMSIITIYGLTIFAIIFLSIFSIDMHMKVIKYNEINSKILYE